MKEGGPREREACAARSPVANTADENDIFLSAFSRIALVGIDLGYVLTIEMGINNLSDVKVSSYANQPLISPKSHHHADVVYNNQRATSTYNPPNEHLTLRFITTSRSFLLIFT